MSGPGILCGVVLLATIVGAVLGRRRLWGARLTPPVPTAEAPSEPLVYAARILRPPLYELVPLLADWSLRGVLAVERVGPSQAKPPGSAAAPGPVWRITAGPAIAAVDPVEAHILVTIFGGVPQPGTTVVIEREDGAWRDAVHRAAGEAADAQRARFGAEPARYGWLRLVIGALAVVSATGLLTAEFLTSDDVTGLAWLTVGVAVVTALPIVLVSLQPKTEAERRYLQAARDLQAWVQTTDEPRPELGGWAMLWGLPGPWRDALPADVAGLAGTDRCFVRGDLARSTPEPNYYNYN